MNDELKLEDGEIVALSSPKLDPLEKLYVRAYLSKLSHTFAHKTVCPSVKKPREDNHFARRDNVQYHISLALQDKAESLELNGPKILERLYVEAIREDEHSSHNARIQALAHLGKAFGLFKEEKEEKNSYTFNIVNYGNSDPTLPQDPVDPPELQESEDSQEAEEFNDQEISFTDYTSEE